MANRSTATLRLDERDGVRTAVVIHNSRKGKRYADEPIMLIGDSDQQRLQLEAYLLKTGSALGIRSYQAVQA